MVPEAGLKQAWTGEGMSDRRTEVPAFSTVNSPDLTRSKNRLIERPFVIVCNYSGGRSSGFRGTSNALIRHVAVRKRKAQPPIIGAEKPGFQQRPNPWNTKPATRSAADKGKLNEDDAVFRS